MLKQAFKFLFKKHSDPKEVVENSNKKENVFLGKFKILSNTLCERADIVRKEILTVRERSKNLRKSNYELGLKHLENGDLSDAIFRFRFIKKFWPDLYDAYYQLAYCLVLKKKPAEAKMILEELLLKKPDYEEKARELLGHINSGLNDIT